MNSPRFEQSMDNSTNSTSLEAITQIENNSAISQENNSKNGEELEEIKENSLANISEPIINEVPNDSIKVF